MIETRKGRSLKSATLSYFTNIDGQSKSAELGHGLSKC